MIGLKALECAFSPWETAKGYPDIYLHSFFICISLFNHRIKNRFKGFA